MSYSLFRPDLALLSSWWLVAGVLGAGCATGGLPDRPELKPYEQQQWVAPLKSGLRVIVQEDHSSPLVTVVSTYGAGSNDDPQGVEGLAHFVEHLVFRSKPGGGAQQYWDHLKRMGAVDFNAYTAADVTSYYVQAHKSNLHQLMQLQAWQLARTLDGVMPEIFTTEREVVRSELRQRLETTVGNRLWDIIFKALYPSNHPLYRPGIGTHESLNNAKLEHAKAFVKEHYVPSNCTVVITGDVDTEEVKKLLGMWPAEILFGSGGPEGEAVSPRKRLGERPMREVPPPGTKTMVREKGPLSDPLLVLAWSLPGAYRGNDAMLTFLERRLDLALQAGLDLKEEDEILGAGALSIPMAESSVIAIMADLEPGADPEKIRGRILDVLVHSWSTDTGDLSAMMQEMGADFDWKKLQTESVRWSAATGLLMTADNPVAKALGVSEYMTATGKSTFFKSQFEDLAALKSTEISDYAYKWVTRDRAVAVYIEPDMTSAARIVGGGGGGGGTSSGRSTHEVGGDITIATEHLTSENLLKLVKSPEIAKLPRQKLANGLEIFTIARESAPVARVAVGVRGGDASVKPLGLASLANNWARTKCRNTEGLDPVGGWLFRNTGLTSSSVDVAVPSGNLANGLAALSDEVACLEVDDEQFLRLSRVVERVSKRYQRRAKRPEFIAGKILSENLYPGHPFGEYGYEDPAKLKGVRREDAQSFVSGHYRPENAMAVVYGDVQPDKVKELSEKYLSKWRGGAGAAAMSPPAAPPGPTKRKIFLVDWPKATQAMITVGCRLADIVPERIAAYDVLATVANEQAEALREQWGATYGVYAGVSTHAGGAADLTIGGAVDTAQTARALIRLLEITTGIAAGKVSEPLFLVSRWDVGRSFMSRMASADMMAFFMSMAHSKGWPLEVYDKYPENLASTTRETLQQLAKPCLAKEIVTIAGDASVLRPQLEREGLKLEAQ
jgi:predicted Zn-dependent peptidase